MPKEVKGDSGRKPPEPSPDHTGIDDWLCRQMPDLQPILRQLDQSIRALIPNLYFTVTAKAPLLRATRTRLDHRACRVRRLGECCLLRRCRFRVTAATRCRRPDAVPQGDLGGGHAPTRAASVDRGGGSNARLALTTCI